MIRNVLICRKYHETGFYFFSIDFFKHCVKFWGSEQMSKDSEALPP